MPKNRRLRRRPSTPNLSDLTQHPHHRRFFTADPASPPETPTTSPTLSRKISSKPRHQPPFAEYDDELVDDPHIKPVGNGHQFSYQPTFGPDQLSPRSSSSHGDTSSAVDDSSSSDGDSSARVSVVSAPNASSIKDFDDNESSPKLVESSDSDEPGGSAANDNDDDDDDIDEDQGGANYEQQSHTHVTVTTAVFEFTLEEIDPMDDEWDALEVLYPYEIEPPRSRSSSWHKELDKNMVREFRNLNCSASTSDNDIELDGEEDAFMRHQRELRRRRRVSMSSSVGKRTHSELSDSDDDFGFLDVNDVGSSAKRMRKRLHRSSLLFHDPPEQIEELEEPDSSEDEPHEDLARELPYFTVEVMEVESS
ncbi:unnamed protein product [Clonostachys chloroleuca]|uniref:Uncharacterized protein n=1 Tax=Clonostachys chloroleuca TaxID=1926264 RepID=A0AA35Q4B7_9HYPO|nr:unnamed protein product [Clonostachys chloroleuca]